MRKKIGLWLLSLMLLFLAACSPAAESETLAETPAAEAEVEAQEELEEVSAEAEETETGTEAASDDELQVQEDGTYDSKEDVALYIHLYGHLPSNYMTKKEAQELGWEGSSLEKYAPGMCIGGNYFGNYEGLLPEAEGREYKECDIDTLGEPKRGAKRIVFSNDGLIYYTDDHYESFELLYGEE